MNKSQRVFEVSRTLLAILISLFLAMIIIFLVSDTPGKALWLFLFGPLDSLRHFGNVLELMIPLLFTGLAISVMFSASQFNLGAEGAFFIGAIGASFIAVNWHLPPVIHPLVAILWGGLLGSIFCGLPGFMKVKWGSSELVSSLMFNYIAFFFGLYLINYFLRDVNAGAMVSYPFQKSARLIKLVPRTRIHFGIIIAAVMVVFTAYFMYRTRWGYRIRVLGRNERFAGYAGINTNSAILLSQVLGGFIAGIGGSIEVLGLYRRFTWQLLPGYGWTGIIVAILARNNPAYIPVAAFFLAYMRIGADIMSRSTDVQNEFVAIIQGIMILLIAADSFLAGYRHKMVVKEARKTQSGGAA
jgi:simple sugar transport system permease protein